MRLLRDRQHMTKRAFRGEFIRRSIRRKGPRQPGIKGGVRSDHQERESQKKSLNWTERFLRRRHIRRLCGNGPKSKSVELTLLVAAELNLATTLPGENDAIGGNDLKMARHKARVPKF